MEKINLLKIDDVCSFLNVKKSWVRAAVFYDRIPYVKIGHLIRFSEEELLKWFDSQKERPRSTKTLS